MYQINQEKRKNLALQDHNNKKIISNNYEMYTTRIQSRKQNQSGSFPQQSTQNNSSQPQVFRSPSISRINNYSKLIEKNNLLSNNQDTDGLQSRNQEQNISQYKSLQISQMQRKLPKIQNPLTFSQNIDEKQKQFDVNKTRIIKNCNQNSLKQPNSYLQKRPTGQKSENDQDEFNIWGADLGQDLLEKERLNEILLLLKYRIETYEKDKKDRIPISCNDVIIWAQRLAKKNRKTWLKYFGLAKKLDWLEFRNFTDV